MSGGAKRPGDDGGSAHRATKARARGRDKALESGSKAHYEDPAYYTKTYKRRREDVRYYTDLAEESGGPVLEYGCGNGRITLPLARAGVRVTGVDLSRPMLADLRRGLAREPIEVRRLVDLVQGDMRSKKLGRRYRLVICPFNALLHLYDRRDIERFLARTAEHLAKGGELVFDVSIPEPSELARDPNKAHFTPRFIYPDEGGGTLVRYSERFDYDKLRQVLFVAMEFYPTNEEPSWMTPMTHRQWQPLELEALLHYNGFRIHELYGDFFRSAPDASSSTLVHHCRIAARPRGR